MCVGKPLTLGNVGASPNTGKPGGETLAGCPGRIRTGLRRFSNRSARITPVSPTRPLRDGGASGGGPASFRRTMVRKITYCTRKATILAPIAPVDVWREALHRTGEVLKATGFPAKIADGR